MRRSSLLAAQGASDEMDAYERLIGDALKGDATLFAREDTVEEEWRIVAPILTYAEAPIEYQPGSWGPTEANRLIEASGGWHAAKTGGDQNAEVNHFLSFLSCS